jgi:hypothetical protein
VRAKFVTRNLFLRNETVRSTLLALVRNLPLDDMYPLEVVVREQIKGRKPDANARMWSGPLKDIAGQAFIEGRQFSAEVWHEWAKREFLPEEFDPELCREGYKKWDFDPSGERVLVGSTTMLTSKGFSEHMTMLEAAGASFGVLFTASPNER